MASSFIDFNENGFWIKDYMMEIALSYIIDTSKDEPIAEPWQQEFYETMKSNSQSYFTGFMNFGLDEFLTDEERTEWFLGILKNTIRVLNDRYDILIPVEDLNAFIEEGTPQTEWRGPLQKNRVVKVLEFVILILRGHLTLRPDDEIDYEF